MYWYWLAVFPKDLRSATERRPLQARLRVGAVVFMGFVVWLGGSSLLQFGLYNRSRRRPNVGGWRFSQRASTNRKLWDHTYTPARS